MPRETAVLNAPPMPATGQRSFADLARRVITARIFGPLLETGMLKSAKACAPSLEPAACRDAAWRVVRDGARTAASVPALLRVMAIGKEFGLEPRHVMDVLFLRLVKNPVVGHSDAPFFKLEHNVLPAIEKRGREYGWIGEMRESARELDSTAYRMLADDVQRVKIIARWGREL